jgi:hypothetical protein
MVLSEESWQVVARVDAWGCYHDIRPLEEVLVDGSRAEQSNGDERNRAGRVGAWWGERKSVVCFDAGGGIADKDAAETWGGESGLGLVGTRLRQPQLDVRVVTLIGQEIG